MDVHLDGNHGSAQVSLAILLEVLSESTVLMQLSFLALHGRIKLNTSHLAQNSELIDFCLSLGSLLRDAASAEFFTFDENIKIRCCREVKGEISIYCRLFYPLLNPSGLSHQEDEEWPGTRVEYGPIVLDNTAVERLYHGLSRFISDYDLKDNNPWRA